MIVYNFNLVCIVPLPAEADAPLDIDPNAPLAAAIALERFQSSAGKYNQIAQSSGVVQHTQLPQSYSLHGVIQPSREPAMPKALSLFAGKAGNHRPKLRCCPERVNFTAVGATRTSSCAPGRRESRWPDHGSRRNLDHRTRLFLSTHSDCGKRHTVVVRGGSSAAGVRYLSWTAPNDRACCAREAPM
jgi:hypothetical protein